VQNFTCLLPVAVYWHQRKSKENIRTDAMLHYDVRKYKLKNVSYFPVLLPVLFEDAEFSVVNISSISEFCTSATLILCQLIGSQFKGNEVWLSCSAAATKQSSLKIGHLVHKIHTRTHTHKTWRLVKLTFVFYRTVSRLTRQAEYV